MFNRITKILGYIIAVLAVLLLSLLLLKNSFSYSDLDLSWHLQVGNNIIKNHQISSVNQYNYTLENEVWVDHEWGLNVLMAYIYNYSSFFLLHLTFLFLALMAIYLAWKRSLLFNKACFNKYISFIFLFIGIWASQPHLGLRVQEFGLIGVISLLFLIDTYPQKKYLLYFTPILFLIWANFHASFVLGLALLTLYCGYLYLAPYLRKLSFLKYFSLALLSNKEKNRVLLILIFSFLFTLINPYGFQLYSFLSGYGNTFYMSYIREWQGQFSLPLFYPQIIYLSLSMAGAIVWVWASCKKNKKISLWNYGLFILFFILSWRSRRHFPLFVLVSLPLVALFYKEVFEYFWKFYISNAKLIVFSFLAASLVFTSVLVAISLPFNQHPVNSFCAKQYPCAAVNYLKNNQETFDKRLFSEYNWGGYLIGAYPTKKTFIDGRMPQVLYKEHSILEEYLEFRKSTLKAKEKLDEYQIGLVLIKNKLSGLKLKNWEKIVFRVNDEDLLANDFLKDYLSQSDEWKLIFQDDLSVIYIRK